MKSISASRLRKEIFSVLDEVTQGETIEITRHGTKVAVISPVDPPDWRQRVRHVPRLSTDPDAAFAPLDEEWAPYR